MWGGGSATNLAPVYCALCAADAQSNLGSGDAFPGADASFAFRLEALRAALRQFFFSSGPSYAKSFRVRLGAQQDLSAAPGCVCPLF